MTVNVGVMELPVTEDPDPVRTYLNGTHPSGGLWTALTRASNHDHSGGLSGVQLGATSIPDGSITTAKLDPSVLGPYALTDGSKPFTGQVSMNADAVVRDALYFGAQGSAGAADVTLSRTGAGAFALANTATRLALDATGALTLSPDAGASALTANGYVVVNAAAGNAPLQWTVGGVAKGSVGQNGTLTLTPDAGASALNANGTVDVVVTGANAPYRAFVDGNMRFYVNHQGTIVTAPLAGAPSLDMQTGYINATGNHIVLNPPSGLSVIPRTHNAHHLGLATTNSWVTVYAIGGVSQTSTYEYKRDFKPLDPAACASAVLETDWVDFTYVPPVYVEPDPAPGEAYDEHDSNEVKAEKKAAREARLDESKQAYAESLVENAPARHQKGYVLQSPEHKTADLFGLSDRQQTSVASDLAVVACALQDALRRLAALEGTPAR